MLMKHSKVLRDGTYIEPPLAQLAFGALINGRVSMVGDSGNISKKALTIAIRYAAIRRQFGGNSSEPETKLLDYVIHQHRLMPLLAQAVCCPALANATVCHALYRQGSHRYVRRPDAPP